MGPLRLEGEYDYTLEEDQNCVWITVGNISVYIRKHDEGVAVDLYPLGQEMYDSIVGTWALFSEAEEYIEDEYGYRNQRRGPAEDWTDPVRSTKDGDAKRLEGGD